YDSSGLLFGLALLCKLSSIFSLGIIIFPLAREVFENRRLKMKTILKWITLSMRVILVASVIFLAGLWIYDVAYGVFSGNPLNHLNYMFNYHSILRYNEEDVISGNVILPLRWINPFDLFSPSKYYEYYPIAYYGIYTPLWWSIWLITPVSLLKAMRKKETVRLFHFLMDCSKLSSIHYFSLRLTQVGLPVLFLCNVARTVYGTISISGLP
ncbi:MAG: hypothetical protein QXR45_03290, partial [Candidatus Bathyarchaeia archaeon]